MINAVIVEDDPTCIKRLNRLLMKHCANSVNILASYTTVEDALIGIRHHQPELLFLDVVIEDKTGFDLLENLKDNPVEVIFTTAFEKYALRAIKFSAVDFLVKPINPDELKAAIHKMQNRSLRPELLAKMWNTLLQNTQTKNQLPRNLLLTNQNGWEAIKLSDIIRCEAADNYTLIILKDGPQILVTRTLKEFDELLTDLDFHRIHRSHLVNLNYVQKYLKKDIEKYEENNIEIKIEKYDQVLMSNGNKIPVSNDLRSAFVERIKRFTLSLKQNNNK